MESPMKLFGSASNIKIVGVPLDRPPYKAKYRVHLDQSGRRPHHRASVYAAFAAGLLLKGRSSLISS